MFSEGQPSKAHDCENTGARGHHQPAPTITSALYNFRKTYQTYTLCPAPRLLHTGSPTISTSRLGQMSRQVSVSNKMRTEKQQQHRHVFRASFLLLRCRGYDATKVVLIKFGFSWTNICFDFIRRSFQS